MPSVSPAIGRPPSRRPGRRRRMLQPMNRRRFLQALGAGALVLSHAVPTRAATQGDRLVVAVGQWGIETPFAWRSSQSEKTLWDCVYDPLIMRDPKTFEYRPGLATEWQSSADFKSWTFHLRQGIKFHENWGELTGEENQRPDVQGGSAPFFRTQLDRIELPEPYTVVMHFKTPVWEVPSHF